jgi:hypothetical protein
MTKIKRTLLFALGIVIISAIATLITVRDVGETSELLKDKFLLLWLSSFLPIAVSAFVSAFLYHTLCESKKTWVHILWFVLNVSFIVAFFAIVIKLLLVALRP